MALSHLSDEALLAGLATIDADCRKLLARLVVYLAEVEDRRLDLKAACTSMLDFCVRRLGMSVGAACRRINAARLVRRLPSLVGAIERGEVHLCALDVLRDHLNESNVDELIAATAGLSVREIQQLVARTSSTPDAGGPLLDRITPPLTDACGLTASTVPDASTVSSGSGASSASGARVSLHLMASEELRQKLERARDLMSHRNPGGDLAVVVDRALDALLDKLEKERLGKSARPQRAVRPSKPGHIARSVRREVFARDGEQCTFTSAAGERCPSRALLELDHIASRALGGPDDATNLRVRCRAHNRLHAEEVFGRTHVATRIHFRQRKSPPPGSATRSASSSSALSRTVTLSPSPIDLEAAIRGLTGLGFAERHARRAAASVVEQRRRLEPEIALPLVDVVREAIALLT